MYSQAAAVAELAEKRERSRLAGRAAGLRTAQRRAARREADFAEAAARDAKAVRSAPRRAAPMQLRPYQEAAVAKAVDASSASWRRLLVLATGAGKTVIAAEILNRALTRGGRALFLAHRDELLTQAKAEIEGFISDFEVAIEKGDLRAARSRRALNQKKRHVVVGSILSMQGKRLRTWDPGAFDVVIIDEAHHGAAKSYKNIIEYFGCMCDDRRTPLIGVTATPERSDKVGLDVVFQEIAAEYNIRDLIDAGFLCDIRAISVESGTDIRGVEMRCGDFKQRQLEDAVDNDKRNGLILAAYQEHASDRPTIIFAAGVAHAKDLAGMFTAAGVPTEAVWGEMGAEGRQAALARYARGETRVLTNFALLTEGFNAPQTSCIILARPTTSALIVTQAIGRGTRLYPGKENCLVIDVIDVTKGKELFTAASLAGLPPEFDAKGEDIHALASEFGELKELAPKLARRALDPETLRKWLAKVKEDLRTHELNLLNRPVERNPVVIPPYLPENPQSYHSPFAWKQTARYTYAITTGTLDDPWTYRICGGTGKWVVSHEEEGYVTVDASCENVFEAAHTADVLIAEQHTDTRAIERHPAPRPEHLATEKQIALLHKLRAEVPEGLTKAEAGRMIGPLLAERKQWAIRKRQMAMAV